MKKWSLCGSFVILGISALLLAMDLGVAMYALDSPITREQLQRVTHSVIVIRDVAMAMQPLGALLAWLATPATLSIARRVGCGLGVLVGVNVVFFMAALLFGDPLMRLVFRQLTRS